ncbi:hypothetical protein EW146_g6961 [Bondarzewia mesenterica]|uniref:RING-type domain-containing protein n=1 Tax=Bondarzewia mesenterica TaxID=1095465 RepID=A0A4S4LP22_9AGAM|nr:hypothetical protein EW146_g6961 [Bondarzewia mesenterica]
MQGSKIWKRIISVLKKTFTPNARAVEQVSRVPWNWKHTMLNAIPPPSIPGPSISSTVAEESESSVTESPDSVIAGMLAAAIPAMRGEPEARKKGKGRLYEPESEQSLPIEEDASIDSFTVLTSRTHSPQFSDADMHQIISQSGAYDDSTPASLLDHPDALLFDVSPVDEVAGDVFGIAQNDVRSEHQDVESHAGQDSSITMSQATLRADEVAPEAELSSARQAQNTSPHLDEATNAAPANAPVAPSPSHVQASPRPSAPSPIPSLSEPPVRYVSHIYCRSCRRDPCLVTTATMCGHIFCNKLFESDEALEQHIREPAIHPKCGFCSGIFESAAVLIEHVTSLHVPNTLGQSSSSISTIKPATKPAEILGSPGPSPYGSRTASFRNFQQAIGFDKRATHRHGMPSTSATSQSSIFSCSSAPSTISPTLGSITPPITDDEDVSGAHDSGKAFPLNASSSFQPHFRNIWDEKLDFGFTVPAKAPSEDSLASPIPTPRRLRTTVSVFDEFLFRAPTIDTRNVLTPLAASGQASTLRIQPSTSSKVPLAQTPSSGDPSHFYLLKGIPSPIPDLLRTSGVLRPAIAPDIETERSAPENLFHCRICRADPCKEITVTACGHVFCHNCIVEKIRETSRCPVCNAAILLYTLLKLDVVRPLAAYTADFEGNHYIACRVALALSLVALSSPSPTPRYYSENFLNMSDTESKKSGYRLEYSANNRAKCKGAWFYPMFMMVLGVELMVTRVCRVYRTETVFGWVGSVSSEMLLLIDGYVRAQAPPLPRVSCEWGPSLISAATQAMPGVTGAAQRPKMFANMKKQFEDASELDGFEELKEEDKERVQKAWEEDHVADEDIPATAKKSEEDEEAEEEEKPKAKRAPAKKKAENGDAEDKPKRGRPKKKAEEAEEGEEEEIPKKKVAARKPRGKVEEEVEEHEEEEEAVEEKPKKKAPARKPRAKKAAEEEGEEEEKPKKKAAKKPASKKAAPKKKKQEEEESGEDFGAELEKVDEDDVLEEDEAEEETNKKRKRPVPKASGSKPPSKKAKPSSSRAKKVKEIVDNYDESDEE